MVDPRHVKKLLSLAKELGLQELDLEEPELKLKARFGGPELVQAAQAPSRAELEAMARKRREAVTRPAIASLYEKSPVFDFKAKD